MSTITTKTALQTTQVSSVLRTCGLSTDRFLTIELRDISASATAELVIHTLNRYHVQDIDDKIIDEIYRQSGGNPVYAVELTKTCGEYIAKHHIRPRDITIELSSMLQSSHLTRVEEVICYRFDQLSLHCQLALKAISVASSNGTAADFRLLVSILSDEEGDSVLLIPSDCDFKTKVQILIDSIREALSREEFVVVRNSESSDRTLEDQHYSVLEIDQLLHAWDEDSEKRLQRLCIAFDIEIEQRVIYDLMLEEQKGLFHHKVALFLEAKHAQQTTSSSTTAMQIYEEGHHWQRAGVWPQAMTCYFQSGMLLDAMGALIESRFHLLLAYQMQNALKKDAGVELVEEKQPPKLMELLHDLNNATKNESQPGSSGTSRTVSHQGRRIKLIDKFQQDKKLASKLVVYKTFGGDVSLLEVGMNILLRLAQSCLTLDNDTTITAELYEEALELMTLTRPLARARTVSNSPTPLFINGIIGTHGHTSRPSSLALRRDSFMMAISSAEHDGAVVVGGGGEEELQVSQAELDAFGLRDPAICFPVLSGLIVMYHSKKLADDRNMSKETHACELFLSIARSDEEKYRAHLTLGLTFMRNIHHELGRIQEGLALIDESMALYDYATQTQEITKVYGADRMPRVFAVNLQVLVLCEDAERTARYINYLADLVPQVQHLHTMAQLVIPFAAALVELGRVPDAHRYFTKYLELEANQMAFSHFKDINPVLMTWIRLELREFLLLEQQQQQSQQHLETGDDYSPRSSTSSIRSVPGAILQAPAQMLLDKIRNKVFLKFPMSGRNMVFTGLDFFGAGIEYVCARVMFLHTLHQVYSLLGAPMDGGNLFCDRDASNGSVCSEKIAPMSRAMSLQRSFLRPSSSSASLRSSVSSSTGKHNHDSSANSSSASSCHGYDRVHDEADGEEVGSSWPHLMGTTASADTVEQWRAELQVTMDYIDYYLECIKEDANFTFVRYKCLVLQAETLSLLRSLSRSTAEVAQYTVKIADIRSVGSLLADQYQFPWIRQKMALFH